MYLDRFPPIVELVWSSSQNTWLWWIPNIRAEESWYVAVLSLALNRYRGRVSCDVNFVVKCDISELPTRMLWTLDIRRFSLPYMLDICNKWYTLSWFVWRSIIFTRFPTCAVNSLCFAVFGSANASTYLSLLCCCDLWNRASFNDSQHMQWNLDISRSVLPCTPTDSPNSCDLKIKNHKTHDLGGSQISE